MIVSQHYSKFQKAPVISFSLHDSAYWIAR